VSGGGGGSDFVTPSASGVVYEDGAGGAGGEDSVDVGQPGTVEILYAPASPASVLATAPAPAPANPSDANTTPRLHLTVYTHGGQGVINTHTLSVKASCGPVACALSAQAAILVPGLRKLPLLRGGLTSTPAGSVGRVSIGVPVALRRLLRRYLLGHPDTRIQVKLDVTATAGTAHETLGESLPMWTLRGFR
jgi:hypothetical protein